MRNHVSESFSVLDQNGMTDDQAILINPAQVTLIMKTIYTVKQNLTKSMIRNLRVLELGASATGIKKEKNLLNSP